MALAPREKLWRRVYHTSRDVYADIPDYEENDARLTADAAASGWYRRSGLMSFSKRRLGGLARMPKPGNLLNLGTGGGGFLELEYVMPTGEIRGVRFAAADQQPLWWSHSKQALFVLPALKTGPCVERPPPTQNELAQVWAKGRPASCAARFEDPPQKPMRVAYPGIQISYRSDKFTHGRLVNFIHHFGPGVVCYFSHEPYRASRPPDIMVRGGRLRLTSHGIDG